MEGAAQITLQSFGRTCRATVRALRPERERELLAAVRAGSPGGFLARGSGRSYGDCAIATEATVVLMQRLDRLTAFDPERAEIVCEAGVELGELVRLFLPRGFLVPACPGSAQVTVGGAIANDVHGKNQLAEGCFGHHVRWIDLVLASGEVVRVSPSERRELFEATIGGVGLTGIVLRACFGLERVPSVALRWRARRIPGFDAFLDALDRAACEAAYVVGWVDGTARGAALGRGILETAEFTSAAGSVRLPPHRATGRGLAAPGPPFARQAVAAWNALRLLRVPAQGMTRTLDVARVLFPLDANSLYGRLRLRELHAVFPEIDAGAGLRRVLAALAESSVPPLLVALKRFGRPGIGHLSFAMPGHSLVIDMPADRRAEALLGRLEAIVLEHGGRIYLAKDGTLAAESFARMYPRLGDFRRVLATVDPQGVFRSDLARRLRIREAAE